MQVTQELHMRRKKVKIVRDGCHDDLTKRFLPHGAAPPTVRKKEGSGGSHQKKAATFLISKGQYISGEILYDAPTLVCCPSYHQGAAGHILYTQILPQNYAIINSKKVGSLLAFCFIFMGIVDRHQIKLLTRALPG